MTTVYLRNKPPTHCQDSNLVFKYPYCEFGKIGDHIYSQLAKLPQKHPKIISQLMASRPKSISEMPIKKIKIKSLAGAYKLLQKIWQFIFFKYGKLEGLFPKNPLYVFGCLRINRFLDQNSLISKILVEKTSHISYENNFF